jgi:hypothetical protein
MRFNSVLQVDVPKGRDGKHKRIIVQLLSDIGQLPDGSALKIPLLELPDSKENIRAALSVRRTSVGSPLPPRAMTGSCMSGKHRGLRRRLQKQRAGKLPTLFSCVRVY